MMIIYYSAKPKTRVNGKIVDKLYPPDWIPLGDKH